MVAATGNPGYFRPNPQFAQHSLHGFEQFVFLRRACRSTCAGTKPTWISASRTLSRNPSTTASGDPIGSSTTGGLSSTTEPTNIHDFSLDRGRSDFDRTQVLTTYHDLAVPGRQGTQVAVGAPVVSQRDRGRLEPSEIVSWMTGEPFSISSDILTADNLPFLARRNHRTRSQLRLHLRPCPAMSVRAGFPSSVLNAATTPFGIPAPGTYGNQGRNIFNSPDFFNIDMTLQKQFAINERWKVQMKFDAFNVLNHPNFHMANPLFAFSAVTLTSQGSGLPQVPQAAISNTFGCLCCTSAYLPSSSSATGVGEPSRVLQVALRVSF